VPYDSDTHIAHLATLAVAPVDDVCGDAAEWFKIVSIANRVSDRNIVNALISKCNLQVVQ